MTTDPMPGGRRRIDRVLAEDFLDGLRDLPLPEVRARRHEAEQEEADLSYVRRMLQGRADLIEAELAARERGGTVGTGSAAGSPSAPGASSDQELVERLATVLADGPRTDHGLGRFLAVEPSRVDEHRRAVEQLVADVGVSDVTHLTEEELRAALERVREFEHNVSANRRRVQQVMDQCTAEVARRYREGEARVDDLLAGS